MNNSEPVGDWLLKRQGRVHIRYGNAIELIQEIQAKRDNLGLELSEWVTFGDEVIGMVCDLFDIEEPYENKDKRAEAIKEVKKMIEKRDMLGKEHPPSDDLVKFGVLQGGISTLTRLFNIKKEEVGSKMPEDNTKDVTTIIEVSCEGKMRRRKVHVGWWKKLSIDEIADTTAKIVEEIVGRGELEEGTI